jgi:hypothetical protein
METNILIFIVVICLMFYKEIKAAAVIFLCIPIILSSLLVQLVTGIDLINGEVSGSFSFLKDFPDIELT